MGAGMAMAGHAIVPQALRGVTFHAIASHSEDLEEAFSFGAPSALA